MYKITFTYAMEKSSRIYANSRDPAVAGYRISVAADQS